MAADLRVSARESHGCSCTEELPPVLPISVHSTMTMGGEGTHPHVPTSRGQGMAVLHKPHAAHIPRWGLRTCGPPVLRAAALVGGMGKYGFLGDGSWARAPGCQLLGAAGAAPALGLPGSWAAGAASPPWAGSCALPRERTLSRGVGRFMSKVLRVLMVGVCV